MADVARPPRVVFSWRRLRGGLRAVRVRWFPPYQMMYDAAMALWRQVPHGGGLLGAVLSVPLVSLSTKGHDSTATSKDEKGC